MCKELKKHGEVLWQELITSDTEGAKKFYGELFGWEFQTNNSTTTNIEYTSINLPNDGKPFGGMLDKKHTKVEDIPSHWGNYVYVEDIHECIEKVIKLDGAIIVPATDIPNHYTFAVIQDPQGAVICVME